MRPENELIIAHLETDPIADEFEKVFDDHNLGNLGDDFLSHELIVDLIGVVKTAINWMEERQEEFKDEEEIAKKVDAFREELLDELEKKRKKREREKLIENLEGSKERTFFITMEDNTKLFEIVPFSLDEKGKPTEHVLVPLHTGGENTFVINGDEFVAMTDYILRECYRVEKMRKDSEKKQKI